MSFKSYLWQSLFSKSYVCKIILVPASSWADGSRDSSLEAGKWHTERCCQQHYKPTRKQVCFQMLFKKLNGRVFSLNGRVFSWIIKIIFGCDRLDFWFLHLFIKSVNFQKQFSCCVKNFFSWATRQILCHQWNSLKIYETEFISFKPCIPFIGSSQISLFWRAFGMLVKEA